MIVARFVAFLDRSCVLRVHSVNMFVIFFFLFVWVNRKCFTFENFPSSRRAVEAAFRFDFKARFGDIVGNIIYENGDDCGIEWCAMMMAIATHARTECESKSAI